MRWRPFCAVNKIEVAKEPISDAWDGRDPFPACRWLPESLSQRCYLDREIAFLDQNARPARVHQLGFCQYFARAAKQCFQDADSALSDCDWLAIAQKQMPLLIKK